MAYKTEQEQERVILVAVEQEKAKMETEACLSELSELIETAGAEAVSSLIQKRDSVHPGHYLGKGKLLELKTLVSACDATGIVCDDELSPAQLRNMEEALQTKVMDRTMVILDIFAGRAVSGEGKLQVELAQLKYRLSRLTGFGASMSRLGGGIGTRGPGEKKLETDRRYIKERIAELNKSLKEIETHRQLIRTQRKKKAMPVISMVGYTNAGKSTLLNKLTDAGVLAEDKLFATLDTTTRRVNLPGGTEILLTDTVGFIQKLPHHLIQAFRATLEELKYADILLHIVDSASPHRQEQMDIVYETLQSLGLTDTPVITVFNKMDKEVALPLPRDHRALETVRISAKTGDNLPVLLQKIEDAVKSFRTEITVCLPYAEGSLLSYLHGRCEIIKEEHTENGVCLTLYADEEIEYRIAKFRQPLVRG